MNTLALIATKEKAYKIYSEQITYFWLLAYFLELIDSNQVASYQLLHGFC